MTSLGVYGESVRPSGVWYKKALIDHAVSCMGALHGYVEDAEWQQSSVSAFYKLL